TDREAIDPFERKLALLTRAYTGRMIDRPFDAAATARGAAAVRRARAWGFGQVALGPLDARRSVVGGTAVLVVVVLVGAALAVGLRRTETVGGPVPEVLRHAWQRPTPITAPDPFGSGFLTVAGGDVTFGREPGVDASRGTIAAIAPDVLRVTASVGMADC